MLGYAAIIHILYIDEFFSRFFIQGKGLQRKNCSRQNSAQCWSLLDLLKMNSLTQRRKQSTFLLNIIIFLLNSLEMEISKKTKNLFDSAQSQPAQSPIPRSVSHFWIFVKFNYRLHEVLTCTDSNSTQCQPNLDFRKCFKIFRNIIKWTLN